MAGEAGLGGRLGRVLMAAVLLAAATLALPPLRAQTEPAKTIPIANPGFEEGAAGTPPPGWGGSVSVDRQEAGSAAYRTVNDSVRPRAGRISARLEHVGAAADPQQFGTITNFVDATPWRGRRIRLTGAVRAEAPDAMVGLWLRVDRAGQQMGFFDNMGDRPIRSPDWADYVIEGDVARDADRIVFGLLLAGDGRAWLDTVRLEDVGPARGAGLGPPGASRPRIAAGPGDAAPHVLDARGRANLHAFARLYGLIRFFHPSDEAAAADWDALALGGVARVEGARNPRELAAALNAVFAPVAPSFAAWAGSPAPAFAINRPAADAHAVRWRHVGYGENPSHVYSSARVEAPGVAAGDVLVVPLAGGVHARVPIVLWRDAAGHTLPQATAPRLPTGKPADFVPAGFDRTTRLAAVVAAWSMFQHFYPYFDIVRVDWDAELDRALAAAAIDADDLAFDLTLRRLVASLRDGHASVRYPSGPRGRLPLAWDWIQNRLVVTAAGAAAAGIAPGDVVERIGAEPAAAAIRAREALISGSLQRVRVDALEELLSGPVDQDVSLQLRGASGRPRIATLRYRAGANGFVREPRPEPVAELAPGLFYVDLDRVTQSQFESRLADLAHARGLVFDLRGYPRMPPDFLRHFSDRPVRSAHFDSPVYLRPDRAGVTFEGGDWELQPLAPRFTTNVVFVTGPGAISYAESVLGVVRWNHLATIVGEPSAGANGNLTAFNLPGGYRVTWTGMRVTNRDGSQHHLVGVRPDVMISRTLAGVRAGRDEPLARALAIVRGRMAPAAAAD